MLTHAGGYVGAITSLTVHAGDEVIVELAATLAAVYFSITDSTTDLNVTTGDTLGADVTTRTSGPRRADDVALHFDGLRVNQQPLPSIATSSARSLSVGIDETFEGGIYDSSKLTGVETVCTPVDVEAKLE